MQRIIVTADDYGMCDIVDKAIDAGIENGFITTTNVMLNMESLHNAKTLRSRYPQISVGIHWNVTTGKPLCAPEEIPTLVDETGAFYGVWEFKKRFTKGQIDPVDLERELEKQYHVFEECCGHPDYWNTHENSSLSVYAYPVFEAVAKRHGILATRTFERVYYDKINLGFKRAFREFLVRNFVALWFARIRKTFKMPTARVISFNKIGKTEGDVLLNALKKDGRDNIEVVFHPATEADHPAFGNISAARVKEFQFLSSRDILMKYKDNQIEPVSYKAL